MISISARIAERKNGWNTQTAVQRWTEKGKTMKQVYKPYYSEKVMLELLKKAPLDKLVEYLLLPRKEKRK